MNHDRPTWSRESVPDKRAVSVHTARVRIYFFVLSDGRVNALFAMSRRLWTEVEIVVIDVAASGYCRAMVIIASFEQESELGSRLWDIFPVFVKVLFWIDAEIRPFSFDGARASFIFDEKVLCVADVERGLFASADDVAQLSLTAAIGKGVGEIDDNELEILFPIASFPIFDEIVAVDAFWNIAREFDFLNAAPDDGLPFIRRIQGKMERIASAMSVIGREREWRPSLRPIEPDPFVESVFETRIDEEV